MLAENTNLSYFRIRKIIGASGLLLPYVLWIGAWELLPSISDYYYTYMGVVFTGTLILSGSFLIAYRGYKENTWLSDNGITTIGGILIVITAFIPTAFDGMPNPCPTPVCLSAWPVFGVIHFVSAGVFFILMGALAYFKFTKANIVDGIEVLTPGKLRRNKIYRFCAWGMWVTLVLTLIGFFLRERTSLSGVLIAHSVFIGELIMLQFFGVAWLVKGKILSDISGGEAA